MKLRDLGALSGEVLLFGGPCSNAQATQALANVADAFAANHVICTGDVVAYGADPMACMAEVRDRGWPVVAGNCERQLAVGAPDCGCGFDDGSACDLLSRGWYPYADRQVDADARDWMAELPDLVTFSHAGRRAAVIHGGLSDIARYLWPSSDAADFAAEVALIGDAVGPVDMVIAGHSGIAFHRQVAGVDWVNAGVIGMPPHDGRAAGRYAVLGADGVRFYRLSYDHKAAAAAMVRAGLTQGYERSLLRGVWPSEEVLPESLRR